MSRVVWRMAWRNLWRNRTRSWILISVIAATYALSLIGMSIGDDSHQRMLDEAVRTAGGDGLVHADGYWDSRAGDLVLPRGEALADALAQVEGITGVHPRVLVNGLLSTSAAGRPVFLQGVRPGPETALRDLGGDVVEGTFLAGERDDPLVLGRRLAAELEVGLGDRVVLTASDPDGEMTRALFHVTGLLETGVRQLDEVAAYTTVGAAQEALGMGDAVHQVGLEVADPEDPAPAAEAVRARLRGDGRVPVEAEVLTWREAVPEMVGFVEIDDAFGYIYLAVIFVVVLFSISNTFLMAVMERVRELGLVSALGLRDGRIGQLMVAETVVLTGVAMALGLGLGLGLHLLVDTVGINTALYGLDEIEISGIDMADMTIRSTITPAKWIAASVLVAVASVTSALYPAWRASRLAPAEAMRFFE